jgi:hypothetical protein
LGYIPESVKELKADAGFFITNREVEGVREEGRGGLREDLISIPILGYIYAEASEVQQYATAVRFVFVPVIVLSGFWMYSGVFFAIIGVAVWLGAYRLVRIWGGSHESGGAIHRAEDLVGDSCATFKVIGPISPCDNKKVARCA